MQRSEITETLSGVLDLERLMAKVSYGTANAKDLLAIGKSLALVPYLREQLADSSSSELCEIRDSMSPEEELFQLLLCAIDADPSALVKEGGMIADGYNAEVDELRGIIDNSKDYKNRIEARERERTGIKTLKIGYNKVFGYYIEVSKSYTSLVPDDYVRKQTLTTGERYITDELKDMEATILGARDKLSSLEYDIFCGLRDRVSERAAAIAADAECFARLDVLCSLASVASENRYVRPEIEYSDITDIRGGRHPVVERFAGSGGFVPNDTLLDTSHNRLALITGPNMAGKSTYMRQTALITLMAQIGSFVPAGEANIGICDRIFTRVGASDDLASGQSTFMVEMNEVATILRNATRNSLLILDEIGRGTSTFDGLSIAWAVIEHISNTKLLGAKTLFATHYHELTELEGTMSGVNNYCIAVKEQGDDIVFLRKIVKGGADKSYGIQVAKLAGVPDSVIERAKELVEELSHADITVRAREIAENSANSQPQRRSVPRPDEVDMLQMSIFDTVKDDDIVKELKELELSTMTPIDALNTLYRLQNKLKNRW